MHLASTTRFTTESQEVVPDVMHYAALQVKIDNSAAQDLSCE